MALEFGQKFALTMLVLFLVPMLVVAGLGANGATVFGMTSGRSPGHIVGSVIPLLQKQSPVRRVRLGPPIPPRGVMLPQNLVAATPRFGFGMIGSLALPILVLLGMSTLVSMLPQIISNVGPTVDNMMAAASGGGGGGGGGGSKRRKRRESATKLAELAALIQEALETFDHLDGLESDHKAVGGVWKRHNNV